MASGQTVIVSDQTGYQRVNLLGMTRARLEEWFLDLGEKPFRAVQLLKWIHHQGCADIAQMTNISKALRERLAALSEIRAPETVSVHASEDGTIKWVIRVDGGSCIESVFIPDGRRGTLCVSSQVGCALDCSFCSTGKQGFQRDLTTAEIIGQLWIAARHFNPAGAEPASRITNVVFMGMGEPLMNYDNVVDAIQLMMDDLGYGISKRRVTLSTAGVVPALRELAKVSDVSLAISLHAPNDTLRSQLVPLNRRYPIAELLAACRDYMAAQPDRRRVITVEYTLIAGINDQPEHAHELAELLRQVPCKINLIPFNPFEQSNYRRPSGNAVSRFWKVLVESGHRVMVRTTRGDDIGAACGQLAGQVRDRTGRSARHRRRHLASQANPDAMQ